MSSPTLKTEAEPRITEITYRRNRAVAQFEHVHLEARVSVPEGYDPNEAMERVRRWVHGQLGIDEKLHRDGERFIDIDADDGF